MPEEGFFINDSPPAPVIAREPAPERRSHSVNPRRHEIPPDEPPVTAENPIAIAREQAQLVLQQQFQQIVDLNSPITRETYCRELTLVARLALLDGEYIAAVKAYTVVGQHLGAINSSETHQHLHMHQANPDGTLRPPNPSDFARATDIELRRIMEETNAPALPAPVAAAVRPVRVDSAVPAAVRSA